MNAFHIHRRAVTAVKAALTANSAVAVLTANSSCAANSATCELCTHNEDVDIMCSLSGPHLML